MADADPQQEAVGVISLQLSGFSSGHVRLGLPDVDDPGGNDEALGGGEQRRHPRRVGRAAEPERPVPEALRELRGVPGVLLADRAVGGPDPELTEFDRHAVPFRTTLSSSSPADQRAN